MAHTKEIPAEQQQEIAALATATANRLAKLGNKPSPRKRKAIIEQAVKDVAAITMRVVFDRMAREMIEGFYSKREATMHRPRPR